MQGTWFQRFVCSPGTVCEVTIEGNEYKNPQLYEFVVDDDGFGFKEGNNKWLYEPSSIKPGIVKTEYLGNRLIDIVQKKNVYMRLDIER